MFKSSANVWVCAAIKPGQRAKRTGGTKARAASPVWRRDELSKCLKQLALYPERTAGCKRSADACARKLKKLDAEALQLDKQLTDMRTALANSQTALAESSKDLATCKLSLLKCKTDLARCRPG
jgi:chromosome segregation ATPase